MFFGTRTPSRESPRTMRWTRRLVRISGLQQGPERGQRVGAADVSLRLSRVRMDRRRVRKSFVSR